MSAPATAAPARRTNRGAPPRRPRRAPLHRRVLRATSTVLLIAGALLVVDAILTVAWQEPITSVIARHRQHVLAGALRRLEARAPTPRERGALAALSTDRARIGFLAGSLRRRLPDGDAAGRIAIPRIGARFVVVKGTGAGDLRKGPGIYDDMSFPGEAGTTAIAGHRTTYLAPFRHLDDVRRGDAVTVEMPYATLRYRVQQVKVVPADATSVLRAVGYSRLVLTACHPLFSATHRIVVFARLVKSVPGVALTRLRDVIGRSATTLKAVPPPRR